MRRRHTKLSVHLIQYCTHVPVPGMTEVMTKDVRIWFAALTQTQRTELTAVEHWMQSEEAVYVARPANAMVTATPPGPGSCRCRQVGSWNAQYNVTVSLQCL